VSCQKTLVNVETVASYRL